MFQITGWFCSGASTRHCGRSVDLPKRALVRDAVGQMLYYAFAGESFHSQGFLTHAPYAFLLWQFLQQQIWVQDAEGFSLFELYDHFVKFWMACSCQYQKNCKLQTSNLSESISGKSMLGTREVSRASFHN